MDLDLRLVRSFTVVADELHFGRAATRLHIAQPALSRQIRRLETSLGVDLLDRTTRRVELTAAGSSFLVQARRLLAAGERARAAAQEDPAGRITVGFSAGLTITAAVSAFRADYPNAEIRMKRLEWFEQHDAVREGAVDVCVGRLPIDDTDVDVSPLYEEPRVVMLSAGHRFAGKESVSILDLADEPIARHEGAATWDAFWRVDPRPDGRPAPDGPIVESVEEKLEYVANGVCIAILPASAANRYVREDVCSIPIHDIATATVAITTRRERHPPILLAFVDALSRTSRSNLAPLLAPSGEPDPLLDRTADEVG